METGGMKAFIITALAVLAGLWAWSKISGRGRRRKLQYTDPQTGKTVTVDAQAQQVQNKDGDVMFAATQVDPVSGANLLPGGRPGTVEFSAQNN